MEDLARERAETTFDVEAMKIIWAGGRQAFELQHKLASIVANDPVSLHFIF
jgi:acyl-CoA oxidase